MNTSRSVVRKYFAFIVAFLIVLEIVLRLAGPYKVYSEKIGSGYSSYWGHSHKGHYKVLPVSQKITYDQKEFRIEFMSNSLGMRNENISIEPEDSIFRILCLGDSYTEGDGADYGSSYPRQLENLLMEVYDTVRFEVINAGKNGTDIVYLEKIFTDYYHQLKPDLLLVALNDTDIEDIIQRSGPERFKDDNTTAFRDGPWYEPIYRISHTFRFIIHTVLRKDFLFLGPKQQQHEEEKALRIITEGVRNLNEFCTERGIEVRFIIHPLPWHTDKTRTRCLRAYPDEVKDCIIQTSKVYGIGKEDPGSFYDLYLPMTDTLITILYSDYAWPQNGHYNNNGYRIMAEKIFDLISEESILVTSD